MQIQKLNFLAVQCEKLVLINLDLIELLALVVSLVFNEWIQSSFYLVPNISFIIVVN